MIPDDEPELAHGFMTAYELLQFESKKHSMERVVGCSESESKKHHKEEKSDVEAHKNSG
jgi:hypothetical protein